MTKEQIDIYWNSSMVSWSWPRYLWIYGYIIRILFKKTKLILKYRVICYWYDVNYVLFVNELYNWRYPPKCMQLEWFVRVRHTFNFVFFIGFMNIGHCSFASPFSSINERKGEISLRKWNFLFNQSFICPIHLSQ